MKRVQMELSNYVYQVPGDAWLRILQAIGFLGLFVLGVMTVSCVIGFFMYRSAAFSAVRYQSGIDMMYINEDILHGFGLDDYHIDEGINELEKLANKEL